MASGILSRAKILGHWAGFLRPIQKSALKFCQYSSRQRCVVPGLLPDLRLACSIICGVVQYGRCCAYITSNVPYHSQGGRNYSLFTAREIEAQPASLACPREKGVDPPQIPAVPLQGEHCSSLAGVIVGEALGCQSGQPPILELGSPPHPAPHIHSYLLYIIGIYFIKVELYCQWDVSQH